MNRFNFGEVAEKISAVFGVFFAFAQIFPPLAFWINRAVLATLRLISIKKWIALFWSELIFASAFRDVRNLEFGIALRKIRKAERLVSNYTDERVKAKRRLYKVSISGIEHLRCSWETINQLDLEQKWAHANAIICNTSNAAFHGGRFEELPLYRLGCVKILCRIIEKVFESRAARTSETWMTATTALNYLGNHATFQQRRIQPDATLIAETEKELLRIEVGYPKVPQFFKKSLEAVKRDLLENQLN